MATGIPHGPKRIEKLMDLPYYTEGPVTDSKGNSFCTTLGAGLIMKTDENGLVTEWAKSPSPNGQIILPDDIHLVCDREKGIRKFAADGRWIKDVAGKSCAGVPVYCPNDLVADKAGNIYYTDSVRNTGKICFIGIDGGETVIADELDFPNGIILSNDETILYIAESYKNRILKIDLASAGKPTADPIVFAKLPRHVSGNLIDNLPDGLALSHDGNIYVAHYGMQAIQVLSPEGNLLSTIDTGLPLTSNLFFIDHSSLLFTGGFTESGPGGLYKIYSE